MNRKKINPVSLKFRGLVMLSIVIMLCCVVPVSAVSDTITVFTTNQSDGRIARTGNNLTFSDVRTGGGTEATTLDTTDLARILGDNETDRYRGMYRGVLIFNTSALPDDATITSAKIGIYVTSRTLDLGITGAGVTKFNIEGSINAIDYQNFNDDRFADDINITSMTPNRYHNFTFNELGRSNINLTGDSGFGIRTAFDIDQTEPAWASYDNATLVRYNSAENGTYKPFIQISYTNSTTPVVTGISPSTGPAAGGTSVIITGTNLTGATEVTFGTTAAATYTVDSATQINATSPAGTGTVDVTVTTDGGTSSTSSADLFTYIAAPVVTGISPSTGPEAGGTSIIITGTNLTGATEVTFGTTPADTYTVDSATQINATSPAGTGTVDVTVTTDGGTSATGSADEFTYVATPVVTGISPSTGPEAGGTSVIITGTNLTGATAVTFGTTAAATYTVDSATQINATSPAGTGTVDVTVTTDGGTSATGSADQFTYAEVPSAAPFGVGVFRPSNHMFYLKNGTAASWTTTAINWGTSTDLPVNGDWNGDGITDVGVFRPSNHMFYLKNGTAASWTTTSINWGISTDLPVTGDWNGDKITDIGVFRPSNHMFYLKNGTSASWTTTAINWGTSTDLPVTGKWR